MTYQSGALAGAALFLLFMTPFLLEAFVIPPERSGLPRWCGWMIVALTFLMALSGLRL